VVACTICGKENPVGVEYCEDCGAALAATSAPAAVADEPTAAQGEGSSPASSPAGDDPAATMLATPESAAPVPVSASPAITPAADGTATAPSPATNPRLVVKRYGAVTAEEIPLQGDRLVVGRFDPESGPVDIDLSAAPEAGQLSRHHAELYRESDGQWYVKDLGSTNGVFVKRPRQQHLRPAPDHPDRPDHRG
jgi:hypothetical protein